MAEPSPSTPCWPGPPPLRCLVTGASGYIGGRLVPELLAVDDLIATTPAPRLVLDLAGLTFWDSSGLAALSTGQQRINTRPPAQMILAGLPGQLLQRLHDTGLASPFTFADTTDNAIREIIPGWASPRSVDTSP